MKSTRLMTTTMLAVATACLLTIHAAQAQQAAKKPNVVIMLADNVGYNDVEGYGAGEVRGMPTPRIHQLASEGLRMTQFLVEPGCTPSRAGFFPGSSPRICG